MQLISYIQDERQLQALHEAHGKICILEPRELARFGRLKLDELHDLASKARTMGLTVALEWDILMTQTDFITAHSFFEQIDLSLFDVIRVQDMGAYQFVLESTTKAITLILETGNHNLFAIEHWINFAPKRIFSVVLSFELSKDVLRNYCEKLAVPLEYLGLGRILLFYTPRNLLSALTPEVDEERKKMQTSAHFLEATGESEESPHKGFPLIENRHGTFMFHIKRLCLVEHMSELQELGLGYFRADFRFDQGEYLVQALAQVQAQKLSGAKFKEHYPHDVIKGYYNINKTDVLFKKLKNYRIQRQDESYVGEVMEASKSHYLAIFIKKHKIQKGDHLRFINPEGKEKFCQVHELKNAKGEEILEGMKDHLVLISYVGGVGPKSQVYLHQ
jgi:U32 family peptidase